MTPRRPAMFVIVMMWTTSIHATTAWAGDDPSSRARRAALPSDLAAALDARAVRPPRFAAREVLAILRSDTPPLVADGYARSSSQALNAALAKHGLATFTYLRGAAPSNALHHRYVRLESSDAHFDPEAAAADLRATGLFRAVIPNYTVPVLATLPNDPLVPLQWHINTAGPADIKLPEAWDFATGSSSVKIGIMDTGIDYAHPDLAAAVWTNPGEIPTNSIDDDSNGFVDDNRGWDFGTNDRVALPEATFDTSGLDVGFHGSHCAGIAAAATNNAVGVAGASRGCTLVPLKVSDPATGGISDAAIAAAFLYAIDNGVDILSMSFGAPGDPGVPEFFQALIDDANNAGMLCVAAAGNDGAAVMTYPAACTGILAIGATNKQNGRASFSTYGPWVDLAAPGDSLYSTICQNYEIDFITQLLFIFYFGWDGETPYMESSGTSMACPLAAGVAGLIKSQAPGISPQELMQLMIDSAEVVAYDQPIGKKVNAFAAVQSAVSETAVTDPIAAATRDAGFSLVDISPNPFGPMTSIRFAVPRAGVVSVSIYDLAGRLVQRLDSRVLSAGTHDARWDGRGKSGKPVASGVYLVRVESAGEVASGKVTLRR